MKRRNFFATLLAPIAAWFLPKPLTELNHGDPDGKYLSGKMGEKVGFDWYQSPVINTTMEWDLATGIYTRSYYLEDGTKVALERHHFDRIPFYLTPLPEQRSSVQSGESTLEPHSS